jgi:hypothetical protein
VQDKDTHRALYARPHASPSARLSSGLIRVGRGARGCNLSKPRPAELTFRRRSFGVAEPLVSAAGPIVEVVLGFPWNVEGDHVDLANVDRGRNAARDLGVDRFAERVSRARPLLVSRPESCING